MEKVKKGEGRWEKKGKGKVRGRGKRRGRRRGRGKRRWKEDSLRKVRRTDGRTHGHSGDFILCPMLCIALDRQQVPDVHKE